MLVLHFLYIQVMSVDKVVQTPYFDNVLNPVVSIWVFALGHIMCEMVVSAFICWMVICCSKQVVNYILSMIVKVGCWPEISHRIIDSQIYKD
jgi:hypothetical protein